MDVLEVIGKNIRTVKRPWAIWRRWALSQPPPAWMPNNDGLAGIYPLQNKLLRVGEITWGVLVQANMNLFKPGAQDHPAQTVYASGSGVDPELLLRAASRLYQLKNTTPNDPQDRALAALISDEMERNFATTLPASFCPGQTLLTSSFMVMRAHLPGRTLRGNVFPLLAHPSVRAVMIVPQQFWPKDFQEFWLA
jgi:hypothetical protein